MSDGLNEKYRQAKLDEDIAKLEAEMFGSPENPEPAGQEEQVLGDTDVTIPDQSTEPTATSTENPFETVTADEHTQPEVKICTECSEKDHRFNRFKGKTDRTIFDLRSEVQRLNKIAASLQKQKDELQAQFDESASKLNDEQRDVLGTDAADLIESMKGEIASLKRELNGTSAQQYEEAADHLQNQNANEFMDNLYRLVPDVEDLNKDPEFNEWLRQPDDYGIERLATLRSDQQRGDYVRVAQFFNEYKALKATLEQVQEPEKTFGDSTDAYAGPEGTQSDSSVKHFENDEDGWIKQSEINKYEADVAAGKFKYDSTIPEAMEARIFKASMEGKIHYDAEPTRTFSVR